MASQPIALAFPLNRWANRALEILPGILSWGALIGLSILAFIIPFWIAIFVIAYDVYAFIRAVYMSVHLVYAYRRLRIEQLKDYMAKLQKKFPNKWKNIEHLIVLPTYDESLEVLEASVQSLANADYPKEKMHVVIGFEERAGTAARDRAAALTKEFQSTFASFITTFHPDGIPGEARVKSANATYAVKEAEKILEQKKIDVDQVLVSNFDSDTVASRNYFSVLTYTFLDTPNRYRASYQPLPIYNNNIWDAPAFSRVIASGSTFWQMIESTRPERLVTFSSHSMTLKTLREVGYWDVGVISEDSRIFWQCLLHFDGDYRTVPLYTTVSMDAALADTWWRTLTNQYKQKRRWAWGIENFSYMFRGFMANSKIKITDKSRYIFRTLEGHFSWATTPIIIAGLGWLPILFGGPEFHTTVLSHTLPRMARTIMSIAMGGLIISSALSFLLLPPRPKGYGRWRYFSILAQWGLVPIIATVLSAFPALDAETRLMLGRDLHFNVMEKARKKS